MNKVILIGRLTRDPELRYTGSNTPVATFSLAVNRPFTNQSGEREADFINCVVWRKLAETVKNYLSQGSQVAVEGRIQTRNYDDQNGQKRYVTEVIVENIDFVGSRRDNAQGQASQSAPAMPSANFNNQPTSTEATPYDFSATPSSPAGANISSDPYAEFGSNIEINDDELPF
jgi:single-strand DNA-binding protein